MHNYKNLKIWQKARVLVKKVYLISADFPESERFGITSQIRRAVISISNNIVEGSGRGSENDFQRFLDYALSSNFEVENMFYLALDLGYINQELFEELLSQSNELGKMIYGFKNSLNNKNINVPI